MKKKSLSTKEVISIIPVNVAFQGEKKKCDKFNKNNLNKNN
jgi:hypothetical protein